MAEGEDDPIAYRKPPIFEATIELRFAGAISQETIQAAVDRMRRHYGADDQEREFTTQFDANSGTTKSTSRPIGHRLSSPDLSEMAMIRETALVLALRAPYPGWPTFLAKTKRNWNALVKSAGRLSLARLGMRYQNRIDIPAEMTTFRAEEFVSIFPSFPAMGEDSIDGYSVAVSKPLIDGFSVNVFGGTVASLVPNTRALLLDVDIFTTVNIPKSDAGLWKALERMRVLKNEVFEALVTDRARELFQ